MGDEQDPVLSGLRQDVGEMSKLVEEYLGFARGEGREQVEPTELEPVLESMRQRAERSGVTLDIAMERPVVLPLRPTAFHRCLGNLVDNACRYAHWIGISVRAEGRDGRDRGRGRRPRHPRGDAREGVRAVRAPG